MNVRIAYMPPGEAPEEIWQAWVGLEIPVIVNRPVRIRNWGVLSMPKSRIGRFWRVLTRGVPWSDCYIVDAQIAVSILEKSNPDAAQWWKQNAPDLIDSGRWLGFQVSACELRPDT